MLGRCNEDLAHVEQVIRSLVSDPATAQAGLCPLWHGIIGLAVPGLQSKSLVHQLVALVMRAYSNRSCDSFNGLGPHKFPGLLDYVDFCAGKWNLSRQPIASGLRGCSFDCIYSIEHDMLTGAGLRLYLEAITASVPRALHRWGTKCSSFSILCASKSLRSEANHWTGDVTKDFVCEGNSQALVTSLGVFLGVLVGCLPMLEQPGNSCMPMQPSLKTVFDCFNFHKTVTYGGCFGFPSMQPLQLWHLPGTFEAMARRKPNSDHFEPLVVRDGSGAFTGDKDRVLASEHHTHQFGTAVAEIYLTVR